MAGTLADHPEGQGAKISCFAAEQVASDLYDTVKQQDPPDWPAIYAARDAYIKADGIAHQSAQALAAEVLDTPGVSQLLTSLAAATEALDAETKALKAASANLKSFSDALDVVAKILTTLAPIL